MRSLRDATCCHSCSRITATVLLLTWNARAIARMESPFASAFIDALPDCKGAEFCVVALWLADGLAAVAG